MRNLLALLSGTPMGMTAENLACDYNISRSECEEFSVESHAKTIVAHESGYLSSQIIKADYVDEHLRSDMSIEGISALKASFKKNGVVTAATASGIVDGSASNLIVSGEYLKKHNKKALAQIIGFSVIGVDPLRMGIGPVPAIKKLLEQHSLTVDDIDLFEINEAFASQVLACVKELSIDLKKLNIWGGAIGIGHPLGATGVRIINSLALELKILNKKWGIASACIGGGQGIAVLLKNDNGK